MRTNQIDVGLAALSALDLSMVKMKIMEPEPEGKGWSQEQVHEAEKWYRRFLELCLRYPDVAIVPNYPIDSMWHQHILDTQAYGVDCNAIFGEILHHFPYFGLRSEEDAKNRDDSFDITNELYLKHFGEDCRYMIAFHIPKAAGCSEDCGTCAQIRIEQSAVERFPKQFAEIAAGCGDKGSGTGCRQGCSRRRAPVIIPASHCKGGGGQKCGSSCGRGK